MTIAPVAGSARRARRSGVASGWARTRPASPGRRPCRRRAGPVASSASAYARGSEPSPVVVAGEVANRGTATRCRPRSGRRRTRAPSASDRAAETYGVVACSGASGRRRRCGRCTSIRSGATSGHATSHGRRRRRRLATRPAIAAVTMARGRVTPAAFARGAWRGHQPGSSVTNVWSAGRRAEPEVRSATVGRCGAQVGVEQGSAGR